MTTTLQASQFILPLIVLAAGLLIGLLLALLKLEQSSQESQTERDLRLEIEDLERQREEIYAKLRGTDGVPLSESDRQALELRAARTLKAHEETEAAYRKLRPQASPPLSDATTTGGGFTRRHPLLSGFLLGGGLMGLVAILMMSVQKDALPGERPPPGPTANPQEAMGNPQEPTSTSGIDAPNTPGTNQGSATDQGAGLPAKPPGAAELPPELIAELQGLRDQMTGGPNDERLREEIADLLLTQGFWFEAFEAGQELVQAHPENAAGFYTLGVIRYMMGQPEIALGNLSRAIELEPSNGQASLMKGIFLLRMSDREAAISEWQRGLEAAGGQESRLQHLLNLAEQGLSAEEILQAPPP